MEKQDVNAKSYYTIDLLHIFKFLWQKIWIIMIAAVLCASAGFGISKFLIEETYSSTILLYVNNNAISVGNVGINFSSSQLTAAQSLVKTYGVILDNRTTLERVREGVKGKVSTDYDVEALSDMIESGSANDTEVMYVKVTCNNAVDAMHIANCIADVLPVIIGDKTEGIIQGATMKVVDYAVVDEVKDGPSVTKYTAVGLILGALIATVVLAIIAMTDDRIHDEDYIIETYEYPILAKIPDLVNTEGKKYSYYYESKSRHNKEENNVNITDNADNQ